MERENQQANTIHHITHLHPLKLVDLRKNAAAEGNPPTCHACRQPCADSAYECAPCGYALDPTCARLPKTLRHPAHPPHPLVLHLMPAYQTGAFCCNACAHDGHAFCYHCAHCQFDLHLPCAALPEALSHWSHPHALTLVHEDPYDGRGFICDLCGGTSDSSSQWIYLCSDCDYGGHINCFLSETPPEQTSGQPAAGGGGQQYSNTAADLMAMQLRLQASMMMADISVQGSRAAANLIGDSSEYTYYHSAPLPSQYASMANNIMMNNLAMLSLSNNNDSAPEPHGAGGGPPAGGNVARSGNQNPFRPNA